MKIISLTKTIVLTMSLLWGLIASPVESMQFDRLTQKNNRLQEVMRQEIDNVLGLAGLNKIEMPPFYSQDLQEYRQSQPNPNIAPFLGYWVREWEIFPPYSSLMIFPSELENHLCIIEEVYDYGEYYDLERQVRSARFEFVSIEGERAIGSAFVLDRDLISLETNPLGEEKIEFLGIVNSQTNEFEGLYTSSSISVYEPFNSEIQQQFEANGCLNSRSVEYSHIQ